MRISQIDRDGLLAIQRILADTDAALDRHRLADALLAIVGRIGPDTGQDRVALDEVVRVDLTDLGREVYTLSGGHDLPAEEPLAIPLWDLMRRFSQVIEAGQPSPFASDIRLASHPDSGPSLLIAFRHSLAVAQQARDQIPEDRS